MKTSKKIKRYIKEELTEVLHTTLNPDGPGAVRIHLIPPKATDEVIPSSVAIINGQDIIPVNVSWTILLSEFIKQVNRYDGRAVSDDDVSEIISRTVKGVKKVMGWVSAKKIRRDIFTIMNSFKQIAFGQIPDQEVGYINIGDYSEYMKAPHRMDIMVSAMTKNGVWHCNQKCVHCYAAGQLHSDEPELSTQEWIRILDKLREIGVPQVTFTGGEPTLREDLFELIKHARWFISRLNTNGIKLTEEYCRGLKEAELDSLQITFYSADEDIHNSLVGAAQYKNTVAGIKNAVKAGLSVSINTPLCTLNKDYVKTLKFLKELGVIYVTCSGLITTGNALTDKSENLQLSTEELKGILSEAVEFCYANGMEISFTSPGWIVPEFFKQYGLNAPTCGACLSNMAITPSGNVVPCQSWLNDDTLGNILTDSWSDIWVSDKCKQRREYSAKMLGQCPLRHYKDNDDIKEGSCNE